MNGGVRSDSDERVILVDPEDREVGTETKLAAHMHGKRHRAVSVVVFDSEGNLLLQQRASTKYHSAGLWSNTCCGHPRPGERTQDTAHRRLREEMGFDCVLRPAFCFTYKSALGSGLYEHEFDHVFVGHFDGTPVPNPEEVRDWRWVAVGDVLADVVSHPQRYSVWFPIALEGLQIRGILDEVLRGTAG
jgi:isopentenyl-diphosphate delta-isomerase